MLSMMRVVHGDTLSCAALRTYRKDSTGSLEPLTACRQRSLTKINRKIPETPNANNELCGQV